MSGISKLGLLLALVVATLALAAGAQQAPPPGQMGPGMAAQRAEQQKMRAQMMEQMKANDAKLDELVAKMNAATGDAKVDAIAAVVTEMVAQRKAMRGHMAPMPHGGMGGPAGAEAPKPAQ